MDFQEFPKMLYQNGDINKQKIVHSAEEEDAAGDDWLDAVIDLADLTAADRGDPVDHHPV